MEQCKYISQTTKTSWRSNSGALNANIISQTTKTSWRSNSGALNANTSAKQLKQVEEVIVEPLMQIHQPNN